MNIDFDLISFCHFGKTTISRANQQFLKNLLLGSHDNIFFFHGKMFPIPIGIQIYDHFCGRKVFNQPQALSSCALAFNRPLMKHGFVKYPKKSELIEK